MPIDSSLSYHFPTPPPLPTPSEQSTLGVGRHFMSIFGETSAGRVSGHIERRLLRQEPKV